MTLKKQLGGVKAFANYLETISPQLKTSSSVENVQDSQTWQSQAEGIKLLLLLCTVQIQVHSENH